jgi:hypothetical protein
MLDLLIIEWNIKMKPGSNSVEEHPQLSHNRHLVDSALVGAGSLWRFEGMIYEMSTNQPMGM